MAYREIAMSLALVLVSMLWAGAMAQSSCTNALISMSPCLNYITGNSSTPSSQCCSQLASVVRSSPQCLCQVLNGGGSSLGININQTQALALPSACNVQTPPVSRCNGKIFSFSILTCCMRTAASPAASPETPGTAEVPTTPSGTGSKTVPSTEVDGTSDGNSIKLSISLLAVLFAASYGSTFTSC